jgi:hypothetical protein
VKKSKDKSRSNAPLPFSNTQAISANPGAQLHQLQRGIEIGNNFNQQSATTGTIGQHNSTNQLMQKAITPMNNLMNINIDQSLSGNSLNAHPARNIHGNRSHADELGLDPNFRKESDQRKTMISVEKRYLE